MSQQDLPLVLSFLGGSFSSMVADLCTFPMDMLKTRMQLGGTQGMEKFTSVRHCIIYTYTTYGVKGFYKGVEAGLVRQFFYSGIRIAVYDKAKLLMGDRLEDGNKFSRFILGAFCGGLSSLLTTPLDVAKIRLINDPLGKQYKGYVHTLAKTYQDNGFFNGFYRGSSPNVYRAVLVNAAELGTYDNAKTLLITRAGMREDSLATRFWASCMAGLVASIVTSPVDVVKTRYMTNSGQEFASPLDCARKIAARDGLRGFYNGFFMLWLRLGPWCVAMFLSWDYYKDAVSKFYFQR